MKDTEKQAITGELKIRLRKGESQNSLALRCGVSSATISQMINRNWTLIADKMWRRVMIALKIDFTWQTAETENFKMLIALLNNCKQKSISVAIAHDAGAGKSHTYSHYERQVENVFYIECKTFWTRKNYMKNLLQNFGLPNDGSIDVMVERLIDYLEGLEKPIVIIDQLDKLNDSSLDLFMDFYNPLDGYCSFVVSGVPALKKRILRGCQLDKSGYKEFYSRIGKNFIYLDDITLKDVALICEANGLTDEDTINHIFNICDGDLRRVKREIQKYFMTKKVA
jgi:DNA transposition AAA+ family ATPase